MPGTASRARSKAHPFAPPFDRPLRRCKRSIRLQFGACRRELIAYGTCPAQHQNAAQASHRRRGGGARGSHDESATVSQAILSCCGARLFSLDTLYVSPAAFKAAAIIGPGATAECVPATAAGISGTGRPAALNAAAMTAFGSTG